MKKDKDTVLVTGANGYVASWIVKKLIDEGHTVHATVRDINDTSKTVHLKSLEKGSSGKLKIFEADLLIDDSYKASMQGCSVVFHTASPFRLDIKDPQKELIDPALRGTENVLTTANKISSVNRIVLTSSVAAMYSDSSECKNYKNNELTESAWNTTASLSYQPYSFSKTLAEKKAWKIQSQQNKWELVVINPSLVLGPFINSKDATSESFKIIKQIGDGTFKKWIPKMGIGLVDVRDVAKAHYLAAFSKNANGRYITCAHNTDLLEVSKELHSLFGERYKIPTEPAPKWLIWLLGPFLNKALTRKYISNNLNHTFKASNQKIKKELTMDFRPMKETLNDTFQSLIDSKII